MKRLIIPAAGVAALAAIAALVAGKIRKGKKPTY